LGTRRFSLAREREGIMAKTKAKKSPAKSSSKTSSAKSTRNAVLDAS
jgi:hypothetical protein